MTRLPVIVGAGGINPAGRSSCHHSYRRLVLSQLGSRDALDACASLASVMGLLRRRDGNWTGPDGALVDRDSYLTSIMPLLENGTLIRQLEDTLFDPENILYHKRINLSASEAGPVEFTLSRKHLPDTVPPGWEIVRDKGHSVEILIHDNLEVLLQCYRRSDVLGAGQLPTGFDPAGLYASRNHPRGLQLTVYGASDAIGSLGIDWQRIRDRVAPDQISVYAGSGMSQLDYNGNGGMMQARLLGKKVTSKQLPLGYAEMPADFINAYILGNLGTTGTSVAACATFLYNLRQGIRDIQTGSHRVVVVGTSEAPLVPEIFDGFATMGALADDVSLRKLDGLDNSTKLEYRRACRPFADNAGFTLAESAQFIVLFDDELAMELGANILGAVNDIFVNADGFKKSIAGPGLGNYITMAKAAAATRNIIGEQGLQHRSFVQAHGTGTPQNRVTESHILSQVAINNGIEQWPVTAVKSYLGHSLASAAGDQLTSSLGVWSYGHIPGITTVDKLADDVHTRGLDILLAHKEIDPEAMDAVLINSKGFGGNNATASILAPHVVEKMLSRKHGTEAMNRYQQLREQTREEIAAYDCDMTAGLRQPIYRFGIDVLGEEAIEMNRDELKIQGQRHAVDLHVPNRYNEFCD